MVRAAAHLWGLFSGAAKVAGPHGRQENGMKIISVMTTDSSGGAEFAALEMLEALRQRGHQTVMLSDMPDIGRDTSVEVVPVSLGPKLSTGSWVSLAARWPVLVGRLRGALRAQAPYDVLMVHYKKEQLLVPFLPCARRSSGPSGGRCRSRCARACPCGPISARPA